MYKHTVKSSLKQTIILTIYQHLTHVSLFTANDSSKSLCKERYLKVFPNNRKST